MASTSAPQALQMVVSYLNDIYDNKDASSAERFAALGHATKYLNEARTHDPSETVIRTLDNKTYGQTQDQLAAELLSLEGGLIAAYDSPETQKKAIQIFQKALKYTPNAPHLYRSMAQSYLKLNHRQHAVTTARQALELDPNDIDSRKLLDKIEGTPQLGIKQKERGSGMSTIGTTLLTLGFIAVFIAPIIAYSMQIYPAMIGWPIIGIPLIWIGSKFSDWGMRNKMLHNALEKDRYQR